MSKDVKPAASGVPRPPGQDGDDVVTLDLRGQLLARLVTNPAQRSGRTEKWLQATFVRQRRSHRRRRVASLVATLAVAASFALVSARRAHVPPPRNIAAAPPAPPAPVAPDRTIIWHDGARAEATSATTVVRRLPDEHGSSGAVVENGSARFHVTHRPERVFFVRAGAVTVEDVGTIFRVERRGEQAWVAVEEGAVKVTWPGGAQDLFARDAALFPPPPPAAQAPVRKRPAALDWQALMRQGAFAQAWQALARVPRARLERDPDALFLAADLARKLNRPADAVSHLQSIVRSHAHDARAALATFTMGRIILDDLRQPAEAARTFARLRQDGNASALAEDGLASEALAWQRAGHVDAARTAARTYLARHPQGRFAARLEPLAR